MKKYFLALLLALIATPVLAYTIKPGDTLWGLYGSSWKQVAQQNGITNPRNLQIGQVINGGLLGASIPKRPTEFKTSLAEQKTAGHSDTTLKVTSITTKDGNNIDPSIMGTTIVLSVNPGASNSETVICSGLTSTTLTFTGCVFGYRFDNPTVTSSANIKAHSPGEPVIISNTDAFLAQVYLTITGDTTITASDTVTGLWQFNHNKGLCLGTSSLCLRGSGTNLQWSTDGFLTSNNFSSSTFTVLSASTTQGILVNNSQISINASSTQGVAFGVDGSLYQQVSSTRGLVNASNGTYITTTANLLFTSGALDINATATPGVGVIPKSDASSSLDSWVTATGSFPYTVNAIPTNNTYYTYQVPFFTTSTFVSSSFGGTQLVPIVLMGSSTTSTVFGDPNEVRVKFRLRSNNADNNGNNADLNIGFASIITSFGVASTSAATRIVFTLSNITTANVLVSSVTANGSSVTRNTIAGVDGSKWHTYEISFASGRATFYVDGVLKFTHITNVPTAGVVYFGAGNDTNTSFYNVTNPIFSQQVGN